MVIEFKGSDMKNIKLEGYEDGTYRLEFFVPCHLSDEEVVFCKCVIPKMLIGKSEEADMFTVKEEEPVKRKD